MKNLFRFSFFTLLLSATITVHAQSAFFQENTHLELTPQNPDPYERVMVRLNAYALDMSGATIAWYVDGERRSRDDNEYEIEVFLGELGSNTRVIAEIYRPGKETLSVSENIVAQTVDLIVEPQTSAPVFYKGKSLPAPDEMVRAVAVPHTGDAGGSYTYLWRLGNEVVGGASGVGKNVVTFTMPRRETLLSVTVTDARGIRVGGRAVRLQPNNPEVLFYEDNPLRGMKQSAIGNILTLGGENETTIHAGVYNLSQNIFDINTNLYWTLDDERVYTFNEEGQSITLQSSGGSQRVEVGFFAQNKDSLTQYVDNSFMVFFQ